MLWSSILATRALNLQCWFGRRHVFSMGIVTSVRFAWHHASFWDQSEVGNSKMAISWESWITAYSISQEICTCSLDLRLSWSIAIDHDNLKSRLHGLPNCRYKQKTGWLHVTRSNKLDSQRIYDFGYRSAASFWCRKYSGKHSAIFKRLYILTFHYIHEKLRTPLGVPKIIKGGPLTVDNFRDASN